MSPVKIFHNGDMSYECVIVIAPVPGKIVFTGMRTGGIPEK
jgi:hypothetical protein